MVCPPLYCVCSVHNHILYLGVVCLCELRMCFVFVDVCEGVYKYIYVLARIVLIMVVSVDVSSTTS